MKKSLIINTRDKGFFSSVLQIIDNIKYCEINNLKPIIAIKENFRYKNNEENPWINYFELINDNIKEGECVNISELKNGCFYLLKNFILLDPLENNYRSYLWELVSQNSKETENYRIEVNKIINKYIKPNKYIKKIVKNFQIKNLKQPTLGVHIRGTDFSYYDINNYISIIKKLIEEYKYTKIYVASDNQESIDIIKKEFMITCSYETDYRVKDFKNYQPAFHVFNNEDMIKQGQSVLIESILLSMCDRLICINSAVAAFSAYLNPKMPIHLITRLNNQG
jgi:hypothetical protein